MADGRQDRRRVRPHRQRGRQDDEVGGSHHRAGRLRLLHRRPAHLPRVGPQGARAHLRQRGFHLHAPLLRLQRQRGGLPGQLRRPRRLPLRGHCRGRLRQGLQALQEGDEDLAGRVERLVRHPRPQARGGLDRRAAHPRADLQRHGRAVRRRLAHHHAQPLRPRAHGLHRAAGQLPGHPDDRAGQGRLRADHLLPLHARVPLRPRRGPARHTQGPQAGHQARPSGFRRQRRHL